MPPDPAAADGQPAPPAALAPDEPHARGDRSGEGLKGVFDHIERDARSDAGLPPLAPGAHDKP
ncbi:MAG: hypothetical protein EOO24_17245 [Comamonadaceae bacterium]|nr:MAG: hypothetical protein EOO24_17245 [Comamonadaceae bacterium]